MNHSERSRIVFLNRNIGIAASALVSLVSICSIMMYSNRPNAAGDLRDQSHLENQQSFSLEGFTPEQARIYQNFLEAEKFFGDRDFNNEAEDKIIRAPWRDNIFKDPVMSKPTLLN